MADDPPHSSLLCLGGKRRRFRSPEKSVSLTTWVPVSDYDRLCKIAREQENKKLSVLVKEIIQRHTRKS